MSSAYELAVNRRNTTTYIGSDPSSIAFNPRAKISDGQGGFTWEDGALLAPQQVRVVTGTTTKAIERRNIDGEIVTPEAMLILEWDAAVEEGWTYFWDGLDWEVVYVTSDFAGRYQKHAEVVSR